MSESEEAWDFVLEQEVMADYEIDITDKPRVSQCQCEPVVLVGMFNENWATELHYIDGEALGRIKVIV